MPLAPIVLFVYNRPNHTQKTLEALHQNDLSEQSKIYIYCDGAKANANTEDVANIHEVRRIAKSKQWCKDVVIIEREKNWGLADSIVNGVTEIVEKHGKVIVLEDDILTSKGFLKYMNRALDIYEHENQVMHISAYIYPNNYTHQTATSFVNILSCWGWATWKRAWDNYEHDIDVHLQRFSSKKQIKKFDIEGDGNYYGQLLSNKKGLKYTWAVRWYASWLGKGGYSLFPSKPLVQNIGFDQSGIHSKAEDNRFFNLPIDSLDIKHQPISENQELRRHINDFYLKNKPSLMMKAKNYFLNKIYH